MKGNELVVSATGIEPCRLERETEWERGKRRTGWKVERRGNWIEERWLTREKEKVRMESVGPRRTVKGMEKEVHERENVGIDE